MKVLSGEGAGLNVSQQYMTYYSSKMLVDAGAASLPAGRIMKLWTLILLFLPICLSISEPASQSLKHSVPVTASLEGPLDLHPALTLWLTCRPLAITPGAPLHGLLFHCRTHRWLTLMLVGKMSQRCRRDKMLWGRHATNKSELLTVKQ